MGAHTHTHTLKNPTTNKNHPPYPHSAQECPVCLCSTLQCLWEDTEHSLSKGLFTRPRAMQFDQAQFNTLYFSLTTLSPQKPVMKLCLFSRTVSLSQRKEKFQGFSPSPLRHLQELINT